MAWSPQPGPQTLLVSCPIEDVFYGGARGGGKSDGLLGDFAGHAGEHGPAGRGILFRRTYKELEELLRRAHEIYGRCGWHFTQDPPDWTAPNGATLKFRHLADDADVQNYIGHQYSWMGVDQVEQFPRSEPIDQLWGSLRSPEGVPCVRRLTGNPPAPAWLKTRYIDPHPQGLVPFRYAPLPEQPGLTIEAVFIPAKLEDNPILRTQDPGYESRLAAVGDRRLYEAWRFGRWDVMLGQVFEEWRDDLHVLENFSAPPLWPLAGAVDYGYRAMGVFGLAALGPEGEVVFVRELTFRQADATDVGHAVGLICREQRHPLEYIAADEAMWSKSPYRQRGEPTIAEEFQSGLLRAYGGNAEYTPALIQATHGPGSRRAKLVVMHRYLRWYADPKTGKVPPWSEPLLRFTRVCKYLIGTIPTLPYDPKKPSDVGDVDTAAEDHGYDMVTALLMSRPPLAERPAPRPHPDTHPGFDVKQRRRKRAAWERAARQESADAAYGAAHHGYRVPRMNELVPAEED